MSQQGASLNSDLDELLTKLQTAFDALNGIDDSYFRGITRANVPTFDPQAVQKIDDMAAKFATAASKAGKIQRITRGVSGPEPKLC